MIDKYETKNRGKKKIVLLVKSQNSKFNELFRTANLIIGSFFFFALREQFDKHDYFEYRTSEEYGTTSE